MDIPRKSDWMTLLLVILLAGCVSPPKGADIAVQGNKADYYPTGKSLTVGEVVGKEGEEDSSWDSSASLYNGFVNMPGAAFKDALVATLKSSGMFTEVFITSGGDYTLNARIASLDLRTREGLVSMHDTLTLLVRYDLVDNRSGKILWSAVEYSKNEMGTDQIRTITLRRNLMRQMIFHDNLSKLIADLNKALSSRGEAR